MPDHAQVQGAAALRLLERVRACASGGRLELPREALERVAAEIAGDPGVNRVLIAVRHPEDNSIRIEASAGLSADDRRRGYFRPGEGVVGSVAERGQAIAGETAAGRAQRFEGVWPPRATASALRYVCVPVLTRRHGVIGAVGMDRTLPAARWQRDDLQWLSVVAALIGDLVLASRELREEASDRDREQARLRQLDNDGHPGVLTAHSSGMREVLELVRQVAASNATVLLLGESGVGKEALAREIHRRSLHAALPFLAVNCGAAAGQRLLREFLDRAADSAISGATQPAPGSVFFDDIGELTPLLQTQLSRFLHEREGPRAAGEAASADFRAPRVIAATQTDLSAAVRAGRFRECLFYRLTAFPIQVPPLRERVADLPQIATEIALRAAAAHRKPERALTVDAVAALVRHDWPGNVRELESTMLRAVLAASGDAITLADLPAELRAEPSAETDAHATLKEQVAVFERGLIVQALRDAGGNRAVAADALQTTPRILSYRMQRLGVDQGA